MHKGRLEAFSDGVIAIIITIMVLELKLHGPNWHDLHELAPHLAGYAVSSIYVGIYWNNHHHLLQASKHVNGAVLWANLHLLFWLSLLPLVTGWFGEHHNAVLPTAAYGFILLMCGLAYTVLVRTLIKLHGEGSHLHRALGKDIKGIISLVGYVAGIGLSFVWTWASVAIYIAVAGLWLIPDQRIERTVPNAE